MTPRSDTGARARRRFPLAALAFAVLALGCDIGCDGKSSGSTIAPPPPAASDYEAERVLVGLAAPVDLQAPPGDTSRVFIVEQPGRIRIAKNGALQTRPFLDVISLVSTGGEQGLLGMAFHPQYATNGRFFIHYTDVAGDTRLAEYHVSSDPDSAVPTATPILSFEQPFENHNGGQIAFGPDGYLYMALGDGGSGGDPQGNGQSLSTLLGKILRIDVDHGAPYTSPSTNPFASQAGARGEIWSYGLRNPWRFSFDSQTGAMWIGDVGQGEWEEIDYEPAATGGRNYGWKKMEGSHCYPPGSACDPTGLTRPVLEYPHGSECSVTGGYVYRGSAMPELAGTYFYGDFCSGLIRSAKIGPGETITDARDWTGVLRRASGGALNQLSSFGLDARGE
ncbi:MAG TPA: PQQ-dependent sugar dehydrogenase, partial [Candidatus Eisenbacteria bacterium]|nr:PQQ-dependent sugar dehydrogenase [Candidatus Eisenbacteria bacterium]